MSKVRVLDNQEIRVETGPTKFGNDWTGIFIRGDNAFPLSIELEEISKKDILTNTDKSFLQSLASLLQEAKENNK